MADDSPRSSGRLAESAYQSPYSRLGAPNPHPNGDPYVPLRSRALATLEAMGFEPKTMVEHGVLWAEHQDPYGHVMHAQYMSYLNACLWRIMESYEEFLTREECEGMMQSKTVVPLVRKYNLDFKRQVQYPDVVIAAYRQEHIEPTRNSGTTALFSLKQQAVVAEVKGSTTYVDVKTGRPVDIRTLGDNFRALYEDYVKRGERAMALKEQWEREHPKPSKRSDSKI